MRKPTTLFYLWLLMLTIVSAGVFFWFESNRSNEAQVLLTGFREKGNEVQQKISGMMEKESATLFKVLLENAAKSFDVFDKYAEAGLIPPEEKDALDGLLKPLLHAEMNLIAFGGANEILYAYMGEEDFMVTAVLRNSIQDKQTGFVKVPVKGGMVAYATHTVGKIKACAFASTSKIPAIIGTAQRDLIVSQTTACLDQHVSSIGGRGFFYFYEGRKDNKLPGDFSEEALFEAESDALQTNRHNLLRETVYAKGAIVPFLKISGVNYYSRVTSAGIMLAVFGIAALLALLSWIVTCFLARQSQN